MAIDRFIPQIWSGGILAELRKILVYGQPSVINTDYEGEIKNFGDTVRVHNFGPVNIIDYVKNTDIAELQTLTDEESLLLIDQAKAFNFQIDDIDQAQQHPKIMSSVISDAAYRLADVADQFIASHYIDAGQTIGNDTSPIALTAANAYEYLVDMGTKLSEANVRKAGRWVIVPPWFHGLLLKDDRFVKTGGGNAEATLRNGLVGTAAGFNVMESNNVPNTNGTKYKILAGTNIAWSFANQISSVESFRPEKRFGDAMKGLHVYGAQVFRPETLICLTGNS
jgi:P22 coat protein - gene protein 5.